MSAERFRPFYTVPPHLNAVVTFFLQMRKLEVGAVTCPVSAGVAELARELSSLSRA